MNDTNMKGVLTELAVATSFMQHGFNVSIPLNPSARYDMIVDAFGGLFKVQVKTAVPSEDGTGFTIEPTSVHKIQNTWIHRKYDINEIDLFATIYDNNTYIIPCYEINNMREAKFRTVPPKTAQTKNIRYAENFKLDNVLAKWDEMICGNDSIKIEQK